MVVRLADVYRHNCASAVFVAEKVMTAFDAPHGKAGLSAGKLPRLRRRAVFGSCRDSHVLDADEF
jgi:hypothetical protein